MLKAQKSMKKAASKKVAKKPVKKVAKRAIATKPTKKVTATATPALAPPSAAAMKVPVFAIPRATITTIPAIKSSAFSKAFAVPATKKAVLTFALRNFQAGADRLQGTVKWFDSAKGFGFITQKDSGADLFVHFTAINTNGYRTLEEGQSVEYTVGSTAKGPAAVDVVPFAQDVGAI